MQILIIQTAFIGDVVLATAVSEKLHHHFPDASIDFCVRKGNESLFDMHPYIRDVHVLDKKSKVKSTMHLIRRIRAVRYDLVINLHRFFSSGLLACLSGADQVIGFRKNPLSFFFSERYPHTFDGQHEIDRNLQLIASFTDTNRQLPKLYVDHLIESIWQQFGDDYVVIAPGSIWATKKTPLQQWIGLIKNRYQSNRVYIIGSASDLNDGEIIRKACENCDVKNLSGELSMLESAALMKAASMNYVNDSAPLHFASAVNAPVTAVFCSTIPSFGFAPLSDLSFIAESGEHLPCRPCGIHGKSHCPEGHFKCGNTIIL